VPALLCPMADRLRYRDDLTPAARQLRREATFPERLLWSRLRGHRLGWHFKRQCPIGAHVVDFCAPAARLVVEIDGRSHDGRFEEDRERQRAIEQVGYLVMRFTNDEVIGDVDGVIDRIRLWLEQHAAPSADSPR
jgi:very-short-patch-repair endonuclease